ncbi:hypothetical protein [Adhaeribacter soli]|uniref:DUF4595 domain-containing protein n=1 Tax=Adhaeribacter soli TaxID=2607655 RepID=A0A5N1J1A9_9BACT|nr:hypothetical protein [Adhaeribacter soli]KAA9340214.1 hypothetical protein F0P94_07655 [Adhaeribacter soli]
MLKKVNALVLGLAVLLAVGCGKDDPEPQPDSQTPTPKSCRLVKYVFPGYGSNDGIVEKYVYDNSGKVIQKNIARSDSSKYIEDIVYSANGNVKEIILSSGNRSVKSSYHYNGANLIDKILFYDQDAGGNYYLQSIYQLQYDIIGRLIKHSNFGPQDTVSGGYIDYFYPAANQMKIMVYNKNQAGNLGLHYITFWEYDSHKNPVIIDGNFIGSGLYKSNFIPQNIIKSTTTEVASGYTGEPFFYNTIYNPAGYPIERTTVVGNQILSKENWYYNCQ